MDALKFAWLASTGFVRARLVAWGFLVFLATVAFFSARLALDTQYKAPRGAASQAHMHAPDFTVNQFTLWRSSLDGASEYQFSGESLVRYRDDLSAHVVKPTINATTVIQNPTHNQLDRVKTTLTAEQGLMRNEGEVFEFTQAVKVHRTTNGQALGTLQADSLVLLPDQDRVITRSPVIVTQGPHQSVAKTGLDYTHSDATLVLTGRVRTVILPPAPRNP